MDDQLIAWSYARQSKDHDAGIGRQQKDTDELTDRRGWLVPEGFRFADNDVSASKSRRNTEFARMMQLVSAGKGPDVLVITYMDRLYRKPIELEEIIPVIEQAGILIATCYEGDMDLRTDTGQLQARVKVAFARAEVMRKANRQKRANRERAEKGERTPHGIRPFGWQDDKRTLKDDESDAIEWASKHLLSGGSVSAGMREWTSRGVQPAFAGMKENKDGVLVPRTRRDKNGQEVPYSGRWTHASFTRIMTNPAIAGLMVHRGEIIGEGDWTPIILPETFYAVCEVLKNPVRAPSRGGVSLGGFLYYCRCGSLVQHDVRWRPPKGKVRTSYGIYKCLEYTPKKTGRAGPHVTIRADHVDEYVEERIIKRAEDPDAAEMFAHRPQAAVDVRKLKDERKEASDGLARMAGDEALGILPRAIYLDAARRVTARLNEIDAMIADADKVDPVALLLTAEDPRAVWEDLDVTIQRRIVESWLHVTLRPPGRGCRNPYMTDLVRIGWRA